ncbi:Pentatricopeptide repeat-containing protein At1g66345, mitochondrial [Linum grandiflorum]
MSFLRRLATSSVSTTTRSFRSFSSLRRPPPPPPTFLLSGPENQTLVKSICNSLRIGSNWNTLTERFGSVAFNDSLIGQILLELREPNDAKRALGFFHWSAAHRGNTNNTLHHSVYSYCIMIHILVGAKLITDARALLESVLKRNGYAKLRLLEAGFEVCCYLEDQHEVSLTLISYNTLLHFVQRSNEIELMWKVYERMISRRIYPDESTIRTVVAGLCKEGKLQELVEVLDRIQGKECSKNRSPLMIVNTGLILRILEEDEEGRIEDGMRLLRLMLQKNMIIDTVAFSLIVHAKVKLGDMSSAHQVFDEMLKRGFDENPFCYTSFVEGYCKCGNVDEANRMFDEMKSNGLKPYRETYNHLIQGCGGAGRAKECIEYCSEMVSNGFGPSISVFNEMLTRLSKGSDVNRANEMLTGMMDKGLMSPDGVTYSRLMEAYGRSGEVEGMVKLYYEMEYRGICPGELGFSALIRGLCECGRVEEARKFLKVMRGRGLMPGKDVVEALNHCG